MVYDVIIAGAGPAGSLAARVCAQAGFQVLLLDKAVFPREKPCAGAVSIRSLRALRHVGIALPPEIIERRISTLNIMPPDWKPLTIRTPISYAFTTKRSNFDYVLAQKALEVGAKFQDGQKITDIEEKKTHVICYTAKTQYEARILIGADGATGMVGRASGLRGPKNPEEFGLALEADVPFASIDIEERLDPTSIYLWFLNIPMGYFWVFPRRNSLSIGLGGAASKITDMRKLLCDLTRLFARYYCIKLPALKGIRGHPLPALGFQRPLLTQRILLVGDAAGFIDVFTGQGICYALESGILAGYAATMALRKRPYNPAKLSWYIRMAQRRFGNELIESRILARKIHKHVYGGFRLVRRLRSLGDFVLKLASGDIDYYRIRRNPFKFSFSFLKADLRTRISGKY
jgi:geranylgeranyl reductase family protein